jgi:hypothetical protein
MRMMYIWLTIDLIYISSSLNSFGVMSYITLLSYYTDLTGLIRSHFIYIYIYICMFHSLNIGKMSKKKKKKHMQQIPYVFPKHWKCYNASQCIGNQKNFSIHYLIQNIFISSLISHLFAYYWELC